MNSAVDSSRVPGPLGLVEELLNTRYGRGRYAYEEWADRQHARDWLLQRGLIREQDPLTEGDFRRLIRTREALRDLLRPHSFVHTDAETIQASAQSLTALAADAPLVVRFSAEGDATLVPALPGVERVLARVYANAVLAMSNGMWERAKVCANPGCDRVFYDRSKNHSGHWCSMATCGSRLNAHSYRQRRNSGNAATSGK
jgi:predicted RNA-binding Zn ribbon-like protein